MNSAVGPELDAVEYFSSRPDPRTSGRADIPIDECFDDLVLADKGLM